MTGEHTDTAKDGLALAEELARALDDPKRYEWGDSPWEHLGDAERDVRRLLAALDALAAERDEWKRTKGEAEALLGEYGAGGTPAGLIGGIHNLAHRAEQAEAERDGYLTSLDECVVRAQREEVRRIEVERERDALRDALRDLLRAAEDEVALKEGRRMHLVRAVLAARALVGDDTA